jgi:hypothetical protein
MANGSRYNSTGKPLRNAAVPPSKGHKENLGVNQTKTWPVGAVTGMGVAKTLK